MIGDQLFSSDNFKGLSYFGVPPPFRLFGFRMSLGLGSVENCTRLLLYNCTYVGFLQGTFIHGHDYLCGTHVHLLLVLRHCCHGDSWNDLQVH